MKKICPTMSLELVMPSSLLTTQFSLSRNSQNFSETILSRRPMGSPAWAFQRTHYSTPKKFKAADVLKIVQSPYFNEKSSDFVEIWCTTADL